jgi:hypothetical protein
MFKETEAGQTHFDPEVESYNRGFEAGVKEERKRVRKIIIDEKLTQFDKVALLKLI